MKCSVCGTDNPHKNQFCNSCGKPLPKLQPVANTLPAGVALQVPVPAPPKGSGLGMVLLIGSVLFLIAVISVGYFVILPLFEDEPDISYGESSIPYDHTNSNSYPADDGSGSVMNPGSTLPVTAKPGASQPVQSGSSTSPSDLIIGTWDIQSSALQMQFGEDGTATLLDTRTGTYDTGSWEKISDGRYRLRSPSGTQYPLLLADPIAGTMYLDDYSLVFIWKG